MRQLWIQSISLIGLIASLLGVPAAAQQTADDNRTPQQERVQQLLQIVAAGKDFHGDASELVPELSKIVERGEGPACDLAIRALQGMKAKAADAVSVLCGKLDDRSHATRGHAVDALVAIGEVSVEPLRNRIHSPSGKARAAAALALSRLHRIELADLDELTKDTDPRVRAVVAAALAHAGEPGVARLTVLLTDAELAVAVEAARGLQANRADPSVAVPSLIECLSRPDFGWAAANALAAFGMEARRAVPAIIRNYPLGTAERSGWDDSAEQVLEHIGPPDERDIEAMCECLTHKDEDAQILAAKSLSLMGLAGRSAAPALEAAIAATVERYLELQREFESKPDDVRDNSGRVFVAIEELLAALWHVTHDAQRFLNSLEQTVIAAESRIHFSDPTPWREFSAEDCLPVEKLLQSSDANVQATALVGVSRIGANARSLKDVLFELADGEDADLTRQAIDAIAAVGPSVAEKAAPLLLAKFKAGTIPLRQFAAAVGALNVRSKESLSILDRGLENSDRNAATACAQALGKTSNEPDRTAALIIESARQGKLTHRTALDVLPQLTSSAKVVLPYMIEQTSSSELWTRHAAIGALGKLGPAAGPAIDTLRTQLDDKSIQLRLQAAKSIFQISGDASALDRQLKSVYAGHSAQDFYSANETIAELGHAGAPFVHYVIVELHAPGPLPKTAMIAVLKAVGGVEADVALDELAKSSDWAVRSQAIAAIEKLAGSDGKERR